MPNEFLPQVTTICHTLNSEINTTSNSNIEIVNLPETVFSSGSVDALSQITKLVSKEKSSNVLKVVSQRSLSQKEWKHKHQSKVNASERERKGRLSAGINKLKDLVPANGKQLKTKENVIEEAGKYLCKLKEQVEELYLKDASEVVANELKKLRKTVAELEKERVIYRSVLQSYGILPTLNTKVPWKSKKPIFRPIKKHSSTQTTDSYIPTSLENVNISYQSRTNKEKLNCNRQIGNVSSVTTSLCSTGDDSSGNNRQNTAISVGKMSHCSSVTVSDSEYLKTPISQSTSSVLSNFASFAATSSSIHSKQDLNCEQVNLTIPEVNIFQCKLTSAFCTPTYSLARIKPNNQTDLPSLPILTVDGICQVSVENSTTSQDHLPQNSTCNGDTILRTNSVTSKRSEGLEESSILNRPRLVVVSSVNDVENNNLIENTALCQSCESSTMFSVNQSFTSSLASSDQVVSKPLTSSPTVADNVCNVRSCGGDNHMNISSQESSVLDRSLLSWLRSYEVPPGKSNESSTSKTSIGTFSTTTFDAPLTSASKIGLPNLTSNVTKQNSSNFEEQQLTPSGKKETKSFNIASLMKSNNPIALDNSPVKLSYPPIQPRESPFVDNDFRVGTPKDIFHQSFENDILDCFNISQFATPEPPNRQIYTKVDFFSTSSTSSNYVFCVGNSSISSVSTKLGSYKSIRQKESNVSLDLNELLQNDGFNHAMAKTSFYHKDLNQQRVSSQHFIENTELVDNSGQCLANRPLMSSNKDKTNVFDRTALSSVPSNISTSLWQPAINRAPSKQISGNLPTIPDCFSSMTAYPYLNSSTPHLSHAATQPLNRFTSNPDWMTRVHDKVPVISTNVPAFSCTEPVKQKLQVPKKRKAARASSTSKRKKSKVEPSSLQKDTPPMSQTIGYQYPTQTGHRHSNIQMHGFSGTSERRIMFNPLTNTVVGPKPCASYNHTNQPNIFDSHSVMCPQTPYPAYHVPYNHPSTAHPQHSSGHRYYFANTNNNNNIPTTCAKPYKGSQHNIQQILS